MICIAGGPEALGDRSPRPDRVWNRIPDAVRERIVRLALDEPALSPRALADTESYFVSEASVYRPLKAHDLIASPAFIVIKAADAFKDKTTAPNQLLQTDFTYLKVIGWGWFYLSTVLDDFSRYILAWKLCTTMKAEDVTATLELALQAAGLHEAMPAQPPRLLSDNGSSYIAGDLARWLDDRKIKHLRGPPYHPMTQGKIERWHQTLKNHILLETYFLPGPLKSQIAAFVADYTPAATTRASTISPRPTSTSGAGQPSWQNEKGSNDRPSPPVACATGCRLPEITKPMARASLNL